VNKDRLVDIFLTLARTDSPSLKESKVKEVIVGYLKDLELEYFEDDAGKKLGGECGNIICKLPGEKDIAPIAFLAHMDTVEPSTNKSPILQGDRIQTNGKTILGGDDHAGVAVILELLHRLKETPIKHGDITVIFTIAEEIGLLGAKNLDIEKVDATYGFVLDNGGEIGTFSTQAPYQNSIKVEIFGKAAHAGVEPEKGISAIQILAHAISKMKFGRVSAETTSNIGIVSGGKATNIICDYLKVDGEARSLREEELIEQTKHMEECFKDAVSCFGGDFKFQAKREYDGFSIGDSEPIWTVLKRAGESYGIQIHPEKSGGGSDTNILNAKGIPTVNLSVGMENVHTVEEYLDTNELAKACDFALEITKSVK
jgi:tripeptide aminopeptidase